MTGSIPTLEPICTEPGIVEQSTLDETSQGYSYRFFVYTPPCYKAESEQTYPVLYLLPGRSGGPGDWFAVGVNEIADEMIHDKKMSPFVIVGTQEIGVDQLANTISQDLIPHIEKNYRVKTERPFVAVAGGSLGSIGAYRLAFQYPEKFATAGMFGGGMIHGEEAQVQKWLDEMEEAEKPRIFLNTGEQDPFMLERAEVMVEVLDDNQIDHTEIFGPGEHTYSYWASNFPVYFEWLAQDWVEETD